MVMPVTQVRLPDGLVRQMNELVDQGIYTSKSDLVRDALRKLFLERMIGIPNDKKDSVVEVRELRKHLSKKIRTSSDIEEINKLID